MSTKALREQRAKLAKDANDILAKIVQEGRAATPDELQKVDAIHKDVDALKDTIDRVERSEADERAYVPETQRTTPAAADPDAKAVAERAFRAWAVNGANGLTPEQIRALGPRASGNGTEITLRFGAAAEQRAQTVTTTAGGYLIAAEFSNRLEKSLLHFGGMLQEADVIDTDTGAALSWPTYDDTAQTGAILAINTAVSNQDITFGTMTLDAYKYSSKQVLVPVELMQDSAFDINAVVADALGERLGRILNTHFTTGTGSSQPNGVATAAGTGKTGTTGQTTTVIYGDLVDLYHSIDIAYRSDAKWMMADSSVKVIRKLVDGNSLPLWQPSIQAGVPDMIFGKPIVVNNDVATMAASAKSILFGNFKKYKVRRVKDITLLRLNERYAEAHQVGFLAFARFDGDLLDAGTNPVNAYVNSAT